MQKRVGPAVVSSPSADQESVVTMKDVSDLQEQNQDKVDKRALTRDAERQIMGRDFSNPEKGEIGERSMVNDARRQGQKILLEHADNPNAKGFDGVFWDPKYRQLCIGEAKNLRPGSTLYKEELTALSDHNLDKNIETAREAVRSSDLRQGDKISALSQLRHRSFRTDLYVPDGVKVSESARQYISNLGGDASIRRFDGRDIWSQERRVYGRQMSS